MKKYNISDNVQVFGFAVASFPEGIGEAFDVLIKKTGDCAGARSYYGLSDFKNGKMEYYALAEEKHSGEAEKYNYEKFLIEKGNYLAITITDWQKKTDSIKDTFCELIKDSRVNKTRPAIEWYKNDHEMMCLVLMNN